MFNRMFNRMFNGMFDGMLGSLTFVPSVKKVTDLKPKK